MTVWGKKCPDVNVICETGHAVSADELRGSVNNKTGLKHKKSLPGYCPRFVRCDTCLKCLRAHVAGRSYGLAKH